METRRERILPITTPNVLATWKKWNVMQVNILQGRYAKAIYISQEVTCKNARNNRRKSEAIIHKTELTDKERFSNSRLRQGRICKILQHVGAYLWRHWGLCTAHLFSPVHLVDQVDLQSPSIDSLISLCISFHKPTAGLCCNAKLPGVTYVWWCFSLKHSLGKSNSIFQKRYFFPRNTGAEHLSESGGMLHLHTQVNQTAIGLLSKDIGTLQALVQSLPCISWGQERILNLTPICFDTNHMTSLPINFTISG